MQLTNAEIKPTDEPENHIFQIPKPCEKKLSLSPRL